MSDDTPELREILLNLELLAKQVEFVLHNYTMDDDRIFDFFKRLEVMLLAPRQSSPGYDESKPLCRFVYEMFSGWNSIDGYRGLSRAIEGHRGPSRVRLYREDDSRHMTTIGFIPRTGSPRSRATADSARILRRRLYGRTPLQRQLPSRPAARRKL